MLPVKWKINGIWYCAYPAITPCPKEMQPRILEPELTIPKNLTVQLDFRRLGWGSYGREEEKKAEYFYKYFEWKKAAGEWLTMGKTRDPNFPHVPLGEIFSDIIRDRPSLKGKLQERAFRRPGFEFGWFMTAADGVDDASSTRVEVVA